MTAGCGVLSSCATHYPVYGRFDRSDELFRGVVLSETMTGLGSIELKGVKSGIRCVGRSKSKVAPPGEEGGVTLECKDGRTVKARYVVTGWGKGRGSGKDQIGDRFQFTFGIPEGEALLELKEPTGR